MRQYYYIQGLRVIPKYYNKDKLDFKNIREGNYYTDYFDALAEVKDIEENIQKLKDRLGK